MSQGIRHNQGKPQWSQIDFKALEPMVRVLEYGESKVGRDNWKKGLLVRETIESLLRHTFALLAGEDNDQESKQPHIGHILSNAMFISYMLQNRPDMDNRREKEESKGGVLSPTPKFDVKKFVNERVMESLWKQYDEVATEPTPQSMSARELQDLISLSKGRKVIFEYPIYITSDQHAKKRRAYPKDPQVNILHCLLNEGGFDPSDSRPIMDEILTEGINISGAPYNHKTIHLPKGITMRDALFRLEYYRRSA